MRVGPQGQEEIRQAAEAWAKGRGYESAASIPIGVLPELAKELKIDAVTAQEAILSAAVAQTDAQRKNHAKLSIVGGSIARDARTGAAGSLIAAKKAESVISALGSIDDRFRDTLADFSSARLAITSKATPHVLDEIHETGIKLLSLMKQLEKGGDPAERQIKEEIVSIYKDFASQVARTRGVYLTKDAFEPELHLENGAPVKPALSAAPAPHAKRPLDLGEIATVAVDGSTGRKFLLDYHGPVEQVLSIEQLVVQRQKELESEDSLSQEILAPGESLDELRSVSDKALARLSDDVTRVSILEDDQKDLTRVYPTKWYKPTGSIFHRRVISDGPFRGIYLDDLVNRVAAKKPGFTYDPDDGRVLPSSPKHGEPVLTTAKVKERGEERTKLYVRIPFEREWTETRQALRRLSELEPSIKYEEGSKNTSFTFGPEQYDIVMSVLRSGVLSGPATKLLDSHYGELQRVEKMSADENLEAHTAKAIGGFKPKIELTYPQQKSLARLAAQNYSGLVGLDLGMGKTLIAIATFLELRKQGEKRPFLVVAPKALAGNFSKEIHKFLKPEDAKALDDSIQVMSYEQFRTAASTGTWEGKAFSAKKFGGVVFDEAQYLRGWRSKMSRAAQSFDHPRKILMTGSVMSNTMDDVLTLIAIGDNVDVSDRKKGKDVRYLMRKFRNFHCEVVGGRTVGVKEKVELLPKVWVDTKHAFQTFIRQKVIYASRRMDDERLPTFKQTTETITMPKAMEDEYRKRAQKLNKVLRGMVSLFRDKGVDKEYLDEKGRTKKVINPLARNKKISGAFGTKLKAAIDELNALGNNEAKSKAAAEVIWKHLEQKPKSRAILFSDSAPYVLENARTLSEEIPGKIHAACLAKEIHFYQNGKELTELGGKKLPLKQDGADWHQKVLDQTIAENGEIATTTLFGPTYQMGQNLQWANVGVHLDRDTWNRQNTVQREGRIWRKGQKNKVYFYNLDWVMKKPKDDLDRTLDEIRGFVESRGDEVFKEVIMRPQKLELGAEHAPVRDRDSLVIDFDLLELGLVPTPKHSGLAGAA
jgi:hypothetical protein